MLDEAKELISTAGKFSGRDAMLDYMRAQALAAVVQAEAAMRQAKAVEQIANLLDGLITDTEKETFRPALRVLSVE